MRVLIVKTSSMGDVIHTLPAVTDASRQLTGIRFDWVVEEGFAEIPSWHPSVGEVIPIGLRRWRRQPLQALRSGEWRAYRQRLRRRRYDAVIDAQGLLKSALLATLPARGPGFGLDRRSAREPLAALVYRHRISVPKGQHAVERVRQLFAAALGYEVPEGRGEYGIARHFPPATGTRRLFFVHGTTRHDKHWPEEYWRALARMAADRGWQVELPQAGDAELARARRIAEGIAGVAVLPPLDLGGIAARVAAADAVVSVDTGLSHLAAALDRPNVVLFGPTEPGLVGGYGRRQLCLKASDFPPVERRTDPAIFAPLTPERVWSGLEQVLAAV